MASMKTRVIPGTALHVSPVCLGTMTFGSPVGEAEAIRLVDGALDLGVNFIDTANIYEGYTRVIGSAGGAAERILGKALAGRWDAVVLATKVGMKIGDAPEDEFNSPAAIRKQLDASLKRLGTDRVDLYYLHRPDPNTPLMEMLSALEEAIRHGKIRHYAVSNYSTQQLAQLLTTADANGVPRPVACQPPLSLLKRDVLNDLVPLCAKEHIAVVPYNVLQGGLLTGKYQKGKPPPTSSRGAEKPDWLRAPDDATHERLDEIQRQANAEGVTMTQFSIRWVLAQPAVVSAIIGVKRIEQLQEAVAAVS